MRKLIAHRALNNHLYKENSILALNDCLTKEYIYGIELDVRMTKDKKLILYHNFTKDLCLINKTNWNNLQNDHIDLLKDALKQIKTNKLILLDLKCESYNYKTYINKLIKLIKKYDNNYYLCSFNYQLACYLKQKTKYPVGIFITDLINKDKDFHFFDFLALSKNSYDDIKFKKKMVWTINDNKNLDKYEYIITNKAYFLSK